MASIHPGYEYDIFISYRHNDNRNGWVTEFVDALRDELAATVKDSLTIYFDTNPHDGLLETHDVDGSLKEKISASFLSPSFHRLIVIQRPLHGKRNFCLFWNLQDRIR